MISADASPISAVVKLSMMRGDIEEHNQSCFIVRDNNGQALASVYFAPMTKAENNDAAPEALQLSIHAKSGPLLAWLSRHQIGVEWK
jgi:hypothetical protein